MQYNKSLIFRNAWKSFKNQEVRTDEMFSICLKSAWSVARTSAKFDINTLYSKHYRQILEVIIYSGVRDVERAKELTNDVFIKAHQNLNSFDESKSNIKTWLVNIAKRTAYDNHRTDHSEHYVSVDNFVNEEGRELFAVADDCSASDNVQNEELMSKINGAMSKLKPKYQQVADLCFIQQKSYEEIAEIMSIPLGSVKGMINRCRTRLKASLQTVRNVA